MLSSGIDQSRSLHCICLFDLAEASESKREVENGHPVLGDTKKLLSRIFPVPKKRVNHQEPGRGVRERGHSTNAADAARDSDAEALVESKSRASLGDTQAQ